MTRTQGRKFEDMFLVKIASKGTSLISPSCCHAGYDYSFHGEGILVVIGVRDNRERYLELGDGGSLSIFHRII